MTVLADEKLADICELVTDGTHDSPKLQAHGVPFIKGKHINTGRIDFDSCDFITPDDHAKCIKRVKPQLNDILIANIGASIGDCARVTTDHEFSIKNVALLRPDANRIDPSYFYHFVKSSVFQGRLLNLRLGAAQPYVSLAAFRGFEVPVISDRVLQRKIGEVFDAYEALIENNRRRIELLEEAARLLYREWFVHFRFPGHEHVKIIDGVPEGWEQKNFADVCDTIGGGTPSTKVPEYWADADVTWITPTDITRNNCLALLDGEKKISQAGLKKSSAKLVPAYTILMTSRASVGFFGIIDREVCTNQGFINIIPHEEVLRYYLLFNLIHRVEEIRAHAGGSTYAEISKSKFRALPVTIPTNELLEDFDERIRPILDQVRCLKKQMESLAQARDLLLPRLMDGRLGV
ncbi:MAG: restriction endonuclease subunit S [Kordiimonadaceae bacterium]|nr:restriction endonuclease subunit S [Kordiimonadaceae bacterium]